VYIAEDRLDEDLQKIAVPDDIIWFILEEGAITF
jgi:hypothetical protein